MTARISKRQIEAVRDDLARWSGRWAQSDDDYRLVAAVVCGLNAARSSRHPTILAKLIEDVARLESALLDSRKSCG